MVRTINMAMTRKNSGVLQLRCCLFSIVFPSYHLPANGDRRFPAYYGINGLLMVVHPAE
jgi:hypothetical protein